MKDFIVTIRRSDGKGILATTDMELARAVLNVLEKRAGLSPVRLGLVRPKPQPTTQEPAEQEVCHDDTD